MSHVDDELAAFEREIEELEQGGDTAGAAESAEAAAAADVPVPHAVPSSHLFISSAHAYAPPQLNTPAPTVVAEPNKPAYQP
jgi:hypothetical protein